MPRPPRHQPPAHLSPAAQAFFTDIADAYELESHHVKLLILVCQHMDAGESARLAVAADGQFISVKGELRPHPGIKVMRDSTILVRSVLRELNLDIDSPDERSRPPVLRSVGRPPKHP